MAIRDAGFAARMERELGTTNQLKEFLSRYFYFCMSLAMAGLVVWGFSRTIEPNLFHAKPQRPLLLWMHGAAFSGWLIFFILQSALVRIRKVSVHRFLGWFGAGLATLMVTLGFTVSIVMTRIALAIYWRTRPEYHRRLIFIASCLLMDAAIGRFDFWFNHSIFYVGVDLLIVLGMMRDWLVDGRVHKVYLYALPPMILLQSFAVYTWRINPTWWQGITRAILAL